MVKSIGFKPTGVREIDRILSAVAIADHGDIQVAADKAAEVWKILWATRD